MTEKFMELIVERKNSAKLPKKVDNPKKIV